MTGDGRSATLSVVGSSCRASGLLEPGVAPYRQPRSSEEMDMEHPTQPTNQAADSTVYRPTDPAKFTEDHQAELCRLIEKPWRTQAEAIAEIIETEQQAHAPLLELFARSPDAVAASRALARLREKAWADKVALVRTGPVRLYGGDFLNTFRPLGPGINIFGPPYDFEVREPTSGEGILVAANRHDGTFEVGLSPGLGGARWATAGVGMVLQAAVPGVAHVAPYWPFDYGWWINCHWLSAHTQGGCRAVVQDTFAPGALPPAGERNVQFWQHTSATE